MTRLLIDTHVFLWWETADSRLHNTWIEHIVNPDNSVFVSAATAWEIAIKRRLGKLRFDLSPVEAAEEHGFTWLPISAADGVAAGDLDWVHRDPVDRMIVAQATSRRLTLVTTDSVMCSAPGVSVLD